MPTVMEARAMRRRLCGFRIAGGVYGTFATDRDDPAGAILPYLFDPPVAVDPHALGLTAVGVTLIERGGVTHIVDLIGAVYYEDASAFLREAGEQGVSRRLPRTLDWSLLTDESRMLLVHPHALGRGQAGIIASVPLGAIEVVRDVSGGTHAGTYGRIRTANHRVEHIRLVEE